MKKRKALNLRRLQEIAEYSLTDIAIFNNRFNNAFLRNKELIFDWIQEESASLGIKDYELLFSKNFLGAGEKLSLEMLFFEKERARAEVVRGFVYSFCTAYEEDINELIMDFESDRDVLEVELPLI